MSPFRLKKKTALNISCNSPFKNNISEIILAKQSFYGSDTIARCQLVLSYQNWSIRRAFLRKTQIFPLSVIILRQSLSTYFRKKITLVTNMIFACILTWRCGGVVACIPRDSVACRRLQLMALIPIQHLYVQYSTVDVGGRFLSFPTHTRTSDRIKINYF